MTEANRDFFLPSKLEREVRVAGGWGVGGKCTPRKGYGISILWEACLQQAVNLVANAGVPGAPLAKERKWTQGI